MACLNDHNRIYVGFMSIILGLLWICGLTFIGVSIGFAIGYYFTVVKNRSPT